MDARNCPYVQRALLFNVIMDVALNLFQNVDELITCIVQKNSQSIVFKENVLKTQANVFHSR